jgi:signal transduction histidine kinase
VRLFEWGLSIPVAASILLLVATEKISVDQDLLPITTWLLAVAATDLLRVPLWNNIVLTMSLPVVLAAGIQLGPVEAALVALLGSVDPREWHRRVTLGRAIYNRSQVALSVLVASQVFHSLSHLIYPWWASLFLASAAMVGVDLLMNVAFVLVPTKLSYGGPWINVLRNILGTAPRDHLLGHLCLASLALPLVVLYEAAGVVGLVLGLSPLFLAQRMFVSSRGLHEAFRSIQMKNRILMAVTSQMAEERRDERLCVAGELHDEVLQPIYKVHLMAQVLRQDLASGRLLELEDDIPRLTEAAEEAQSAIRKVVRSLRASSLGPGGLRSAVRLLASNVESSWGLKVRLTVDEDDAPPLVQLLAYQLIREALQNAGKHANASQASVAVYRDVDSLRLVIEDDGKGFDPTGVDVAEHLGLQLMKERAHSAGGYVVIDSSPGRGTCVTARIPLRAD